MQRHDHPDRPLNPYPDSWERLEGFEYLSALSLIRPLNSLQNRLGEDADYILQHDFNVALRIDGERRAITVPRGLITDLTSAPKLLRVLIGRVGPWLEAAILHDYLYIAWQDVPGKQPTPRDRRFADCAMLLGMEAARVSYVTRWAIFLFLRAFGGGVYRVPNEKRYVDLDAPELRGSLAFSLPARP